jgi:hypothetical protein
LRLDRLEAVKVALHGNVEADLAQYESTSRR